MLEEELYYALVDDPTAEAAEGADGADGADVRPAKSKKLTKVCVNLRGLLRAVCCVLPALAGLRSRHSLEAPASCAGRRDP